MTSDDFHVCSMCGARAAIMTTQPLDAGTGTRSTIVDPGFEYEHCTVCGEDLISARDLDNLTALAVEKERVEDDILSGHDIRDLRLALGLTQTALEDLLGVSASTVGRWERGLYAQNKTADRLMRLFAAHPELITETGFVAAEGRGPYRSSRKAT